MPLLQMVADVTLAHGTTLRQVHRRNGLISLVSGSKGILNHANLWTIAVGDNDLVTLLNETNKRMGSVVYALNLFGGDYRPGRYHPAQRRCDRACQTA